MNFCYCKCCTALIDVTEDSVEIACDFIIECRQILTEVTTLGTNYIFEIFRVILQ